jgi:peptidoglycan/xylan/chitin deacetylase (PgdA/CDA1 family)
MTVRNRSAVRAALLILLALAGAGCSSSLGQDSSLGSRDGCLVLAYHRIVPAWPVIDWIGIPDDYTVYQGAFRQQIQSMKRAGVHFIPPQQLENIVRNRVSPPEKCVLITLDDGDVSQYRYAFPVLRQEQVPFTLFLISGQVGARSFNGLEMMTWPEIREMAASGLATIGSHTHNLHMLDRSRQPVFANPEKAQEFSEDLRVSMFTIEQQTGVRPRYFAYPYGFGNPQTDDAALRLGMRLLFSLRPGVEHPGDKAFYVRRFMVTSSNWATAAAWVGQPDAPQKAIF